MLFQYLPRRKKCKTFFSLLHIVDIQICIAFRYSFFSATSEICCSKSRKKSLYLKDHRQVYLHSAEAGTQKTSYCILQIFHFSRDLHFHRPESLRFHLAHSFDTFIGLRHAYRLYSYIGHVQMTPVSSTYSKCVLMLVSLGQIIRLKSTVHIESGIVHNKKQYLCTYS